ncbi:uncharacterized protein AB675_10719 [Cyphellophora attinorum]|uniref:DUF7907 domain-containing protein n=1 Tax=Cyphellophora attinorum TaxID=1664694 RepID=A0A0N0NMU8_9EURO|nr:uncharacterized protein AB675_10719 [Phialophora attinorum]KPI40629.1 hypothetical protein AB675_10719 [Phialophora attinorum]
MHKSAGITVFATVASLVSSAPLEARTPPGPFPVNFNLQVSATQHPSQFAGQYIYSYHTGAGAGIAAASSFQSDAMLANLQSVNQVWEVAFSPSGTTDSWFLNLDYSSTITGTAIATIGASNPPDVSGFYMTDSGLRWGDASFVNWAVCDGSYGVPQLFAIVDASAILPTTCETINLVTVSASS